MNQFLHLLETLETHMDQIRMDLGADWTEFAAEMQDVAPAFEAAHNETELARAVGDLYIVCRAREAVMAILRQTADTSSVGHDRRSPAGGTDYRDEIKIREIVNRYQSLFDRLEELEWPEAGKARHIKDTSQPGARNSDDRRTHS